MTDRLWCPHCVRVYYDDKTHLHCPECGHPGVCDDCASVEYNPALHDPLMWQSEADLKPNDSIILFSEDMDRVWAAVEAGGNINIADKNGTTALMRAAKHRSEGKVVFLLADEAEVDTVNNDGYTALLYAAENGATGIVQELLEHNAYVNDSGKIGRTAMSLAYIGRHIETMRLLAAYGANLNDGDRDGRTLLIQAVLSSDPEKVRVLIEGGADVNIKDKWGGTASQYAFDNLKTQIKISAMFKRPGCGEVVRSEL